MFYIEIPDGMAYKALPAVDSEGKVKLDSDCKIIFEDFFVSINGDKPSISIQKSIHKFQRDFHKESIFEDKINGLVIHKKRPIYKSDIVWCLEYRPNRCGLAPTDHALVVEVRKQKIINEPLSNKTLPYTRWINNALLSQESEKRARIKEVEQKLNRQKTGDSPKPN